MNSTIETQTNLNGLLLNRVLTPSGGVELRVVPVSKENDRVEKRGEVIGRPETTQGPLRVGLPDSIVQVKAGGDAASGGFMTGTTMQQSLTTSGLQVVPVEDADREGVSECTVVTVLENEKTGLRVCHYLQPTEVEGAMLSWSRIENVGTEVIDIEHLSSFVLSGITPFASDSAAGRLRVHRYRSWWSNEGKHECRTAEELHLIRNWAGDMLPNERFGQVGTMPVRQFFPFVGVEDTEAKVIWGAQLAWAGSWQMEISRRGDTLSISGGLADFEFGHWKKCLEPNESLTSPVAHIACVEGGIDELTDCLVRLQESLLPEPPEMERDLPVVFNEWCTNWGSPSHDKTIALAKRLQGVGVKYLVIDDGWAVRPPEATMQSNGDWIVDTKKFPQGMKATCDELREMGFVPGVWFEFEVCNPKSKAFEETDHHLKRNGRVLDVGSRRFWNLNDPWVVDYLEDKLIGFLRESGFGYLKVDYNDNIGIGCDHPDSLGEGLRQQIQGVHRTFRRIREGVDGLVIENCSSGGHRLEPSMMALTSMSSFSDAHESANIPIIGRQLQRLMPPRQSQIWAVLYPTDSDERFVYSLAATFYGRMCLSGPIHDVTDQQLAVIREAVALYGSVASVIHSGRTYYLGETPWNWVDPEGWSGIFRLGADGKKALVVVHEYARNPDVDLLVKLPVQGEWTIDEVLADETTAKPELNGRTLRFPRGKDFRGYVVSLSR